MGTLNSSPAAEIESATLVTRLRIAVYRIRQADPATDTEHLDDPTVVGRRVTDEAGTSPHEGHSPHQKPRSEDD